MNGNNHNLSELLGVGIYSYSDAARLVGLSVSTVRRWMRGYSYSYHTTSGVRHGVSRPLISGDINPIEEKYALSFLELVELLTVKSFISNNVRMSKVRRAHDNVSKRFKCDHPFATHEFRTFAGEIYSDNEIYEGLVDIVQNQFAFKQVLEPYLKQLDFDQTSSLAIRWWPLGRKTPIVLDPQILFGQPVIEKTRIPVSTIQNLLRLGENTSLIKESYQIDDKAILAVRKYSRRIAA